ncbi:hypothetical protein A3D77_03180 [Candidatus Gottesmanbacteria bacterium RIFCSPHIGHO2_02_FULL_39_11]|uniref:Glycosyltransferase 2-like domain-containing protein n=1 Tax=Candidatus Gottesmanbacteria bacterium RIFCSPHIGHO2_02_FULL_39_11 TaxID=1798382 RepID=A0A1F5ZU64_9BACT|nr:MAG: hypothetical protein A3D77_03180 [Candidatus Gottesmanbacteria bacterium RIFCSPHIGHO2_02_FULL_39_11]
MLSIIIPSYNSLNKIGHLLYSIDKSQHIRKADFEVIIVDDYSTDGTVDFITSHLKNWLNLSNLKIIELKKNQGPAVARNIGVKYAKGSIILFLDADVILFEKTLKRVIYLFDSDPDLFALTGVWDKEQKGNGFFRRFKALRDWSYWINERDPKNYYYLFSTRVAAIRRDLFLRLGGFDTTYKAALIEDIELTYRIAKRHAIVFDPEVRVHHEFEDFLPVAKKYFWRSYYWSKIYRERKKFDPVATTGKEALATISAAGVVFLFLIFLLSYLSSLSYTEEIRRWEGLLLWFFLVFHFLMVRKFIVFCVKEEGWWFGFKAFITGIILYCVIISGALFSLR